MCSPLYAAHTPFPPAHFCPLSHTAASRCTAHSGVFPFEKYTHKDKDCIFFSRCSDKVLGGKNLRKVGSVLAYSLRVQSILPRRPRRAWSRLSTVRNPRETNAGFLIVFSKTSARGIVTTVRAYLPVSITSSREIPHRNQGDGPEVKSTWFKFPGI